MDERSHQAEEHAGRPQRTATGIALPPLHVSGLVVSTAALVAALRPYLPQLIDVEPLDSGQFLLRLAGSDQGQQA